MNRARTQRTGKLTGLALTLLAVLLLAACGSSSKSTSGTAGASASVTQAPGGKQAPKALTARFKELRECLKKEGITLPAQTRTPGSRRPPAGGFFGGGALPKGVSRAKYEAALKKCGAGRFAGPGAGGRFRSPAFTRSLAKFAACMRREGIAVPSPNTSGSGPVFDTKGIDTASAKFRAAESKCMTVLRVAQPGGANGAPPGARRGRRRRGRSDGLMQPGPGRAGGAGR